MLLTIDARRLKIARNSVFVCHLSPVWRLMAIKNYVSSDFLSTFLDSLNFFNCRLSWCGFKCRTVKFEYKFCKIHDNKMVAKIATACRFALVDTLIQLFITQFLQNYLNGLLSSNSFPKIDCWYCPMNDNQDGCKNVSCLSVCTCGHSNLAIYHQISSKFHIWTTFIKLLFMSDGFCLMNDNQDCRQNDFPFPLQGIMRGPFVGVRLF